MHQVPSLQELIRRRQAGGFVGRGEQLARFEANLMLPTDDMRRCFVVSLHGAAGVGKSSLIWQFIRVARDHKTLTGYVDESAHDLFSAIEAIVADIGAQGGRFREFPGLLDEYRRRRLELEVDPATPEEVSSALSRTVARVGLRIAEEIPVLGAAAKEVDEDAAARQVDRARAFLGRKFRNQEDVRLVLSPVNVLTSAFVRDLNALADRRQLALFFDTYELTGRFLDGWLLDLLAGRFGSLSGNMVVTVSGRSRLDTNLWAEYLPVRIDLSLEVFTDLEARQLVSAYGVTDAKAVEVILELSGKLPLWVATLASTQPDKPGAVGDPSGSAVERFLTWEHDASRREVALRSALPRRMDREVFAVVNQNSPGSDHFDWLRRMPFVVEHSDGYRYHDVVRAAMLRVLRRDSPSGWKRDHQALVEHYQAARYALDLSRRAALRSKEWQSLRAQQCYHELCARTGSALPAALDGLINVISWRPDLTMTWIQTIQQAGVDAANDEVIGWAHTLSAAHTDSTDRTRLLTYLIDYEGLESDSKVAALTERGKIHRRANNYDQSLRDMTTAVRIIEDRGELTANLDSNADWVLTNRGTTYRLMGRYSDALVDYSRAIELRPGYAAALASRGATYWLMGLYSDALNDISKAVELNPLYVWAVASRGVIYRFLGQYDKAISDLHRAAELDPKHAGVLASRGVVYRMMGRYSEALNDYNRAIELDPDYAGAITGRGDVFRLTTHYAEALADYNRANEIDPTYAGPLAGRGETYRLMGRYDEALNDFGLSIQLDPTSAWSICGRGETFRLMGRYAEALDDFNRAIELDPKHLGAIAGRGETHRQMGLYDKALEDINRAIELDPDHAGSFSNSGQLRPGYRVRPDIDLTGHQWPRDDASAD